MGMSIGQHYMRILRHAGQDRERRRRAVGALAGPSVYLDSDGPIVGEVSEPYGEN